MYPATEMVISTAEPADRPPRERVAFPSSPASERRASTAATTKATVPARAMTLCSVLCPWTLPNPATKDKVAMATAGAMAACRNFGR
jgi:hypothetical protein